MLNQLYEIVHEYIPKTKKDKLNKTKSWDYGYNEEMDLIVISKDGTIGDVYYMNGLYIALPSIPDDSVIDSRHNKWIPDDMPKDLVRIKNMADWRAMDQAFKLRHTPYINTEFDRRENGHWFVNNGLKTYITGSHYMYLQWSKIDVGLPDFREANRLFWIYWEACVADHRSYGIVYVKIRRSGLSFMASSELSDSGTITKNARLGILSKSGDDAKKMFTDKTVPIVKKYPFFFKPIQDGTDTPKTELAFRIPATRLTKKSMDRQSEEDEAEGLDTSIDWKATEDNSYDGEKLFRLVFDEAAKLDKGKNVLNNWKVVKTCLRLGSNIVGKCMMGSTVNALAKGGANFKKLFEDSNPLERNANGQTKSGLYGLFIPMEDNYEGHIDEYGFPVYENPETPVMGIDGSLIKYGAIYVWENEIKGLKGDSEALNEHYRQYPRTLAHAFRDEAQASIFNLEKIYAQIDYNDTHNKKSLLTRGSFSWRDGIRFSEVVFTPNSGGRFLLAWIPPKHLQNNVKEVGGKYFPMNKDFGAFGCDSYDISGTVDGSGSKGALHGKTGFSMSEDVPSNFFFLEYACRPQTAEIFFEDVLMALWFYGMPVLAENNKPRLLYHLKNADCRSFSLNRPDRAKDKLSVTEKELGGIPSNAEDVLQSHAGGIEAYIDAHVGYDDDGLHRPADVVGEMYLNDTLLDWSSFDIRNRTKHDRTISSGLAIMATNRHLFIQRKEQKPVEIKLSKYDNSGMVSKIIRD